MELPEPPLTARLLQSCPHRRCRSAPAAVGVIRRLMGSTSSTPCAFGFSRSRCSAGRDELMQPKQHSAATSGRAKRPEGSKTNSVHSSPHSPSLSFQFCLCLSYAMITFAIIQWVLAGLEQLTGLLLASTQLSLHVQIKINS